MTGWYYNFAFDLAVCTAPGEHPRHHTLRTGKSHLQDTIKLGREHHVALRLELAAHERLLAVELALRKLGEGLIREDDGDVGLGLGLALVHRPRLLKIDRPDRLLALRVLHAHLEDAVRLQEFDPAE